MLKSWFPSGRQITQTVTTSLAKLCCHFTGLPSFVCVVCCASVWAYQFIELALLKAKFKALKTDEVTYKLLSHYSCVV